MKHLLSVSGTMLIAFFLFSGFQKKVELANTITWENGQKLNWNDFLGKPDENSRLHAYTMVGIKTDFIKSQGEEAELAVIGYFDKAKSWVKKDQKSSSLLEHEQRHFDLCEIYRRKLKKALAEYDGFTYANFSTEANRLFSETFQQLTKEQQRYDSETQHSKIRESQKEWEAKIDADLAITAPYAGQSVMVKLTR